MPRDNLKTIKQEIPHASPLAPVELDLNSEIRFNCHKNISCFNACCKSIDITLLPYDILRLKRRAKLTSSEWVARYTAPFPMDAHQMPGLKLATKPGGECVFLREHGCSVYSDRPSACRYYALGSMSVKKQNARGVSEVYFMVKEPHCKGHDEPRKLKVAEYLAEQGLDKYDAMNKAWREIVLKKRSAGATVGKPSARSMQLFDMCSYDMDNFRRFIQSEGFAQVFDLPREEKTELLEDEDKLFLFACRFLKQVLFGEMTIAVKPDARDKRLAKRKHRASKTE